MQKLLSLVFIFMLAFTHLNAYQPEQKAIQSPTCILIKINRSENKIAAMKERHLDNEIQDVMKMDDDLAFAIMEDFKTHFRYCKVYFFNSPSLQDVISKNWKQVAFYDHDFVHPLVLPDSVLSTVFIVENNYPPPPEYDLLKKEGGVTLLEPREQKTFVNSNDEFGIVSYDDGYKLLPNKVCYCRAGLISKRIKDKWPKEYTYTYMGAMRYDRMLKKYFQKD